MQAYAGKENLAFLEQVPNYLETIKMLIHRFLGECDSALDFGAGNGAYARRLASQHIKVDCVEIDAEYQRNLEAHGLTTYASLASAGVYPRIYSCDVLEHIPDDRKTLRELYARLEPGGKILIYVPAFNLLYSAMDRQVGHVRRYGKRELVAKLREAGFRVESVEYIDCIGFFGALFYKFFGNRDGGIDSPGIYRYYRYIFPLSRALDRLGGRFLLGKNLLAIASK